MKTDAAHRLVTVVGFVIAATCTQVAQAESAAALYVQCEAKPSMAEQRECFPAAAKQAELELVAAERAARVAMVDLEKESAGSRAMHPVKAFDQAARAYRAFRSAESRRVLTSYGTGNGGGLAVQQVTIRMDLARIKQLNGQ